MHWNANARRLLGRVSCVFLSEHVACGFYCSERLSAQWSPLIHRGIHSQAMTSHHEMSPLQETLRQEARAIFDQAVTSVLPNKMVSNALRVEGNVLHVGQKTYTLNKNLYVVGVGKASLGMLRQVEELLSDHIVSGIANVPKGIQDSFKVHGKNDLLLDKETSIKVMEGAFRNLPDTDSYKASKEILKMVQSLTSDDLLLACITGGASALLSYPVPSVAVDDLVKVTRLIAGRGGDIKDLNTVRQNIEVLKAGGLAHAAHPAQVIALILSDIIDDPLNMIASGPTVQCNTSAKECLDLFMKYQIMDEVPRSVINYLQEKSVSQFHLSESNRNKGISRSYVSDTCGHVNNILVGTNTTALEAAAKEASKRGFHSFVLSANQTGEARQVANNFVEIAKYMIMAYACTGQNKPNSDLVKAELDLVNMGITKETVRCCHRNVVQAANKGKGLCLVNGGETVVKVRGHGQGGRNTEFALAAAISLKQAWECGVFDKNFRVEMLSAGTDGQDGTCDAAGALADVAVTTEAEGVGLNANAFLKDNDSYTFFNQLNSGKYLVNTGLTGTNVMDIQLMLVQPPGVK